MWRNTYLWEKTAHPSLWLPASNDGQRSPPPWPLAAPAWCSGLDLPPPGSCYPTLSSDACPGIPESEKFWLSKHHPFVEYHKMHTDIKQPGVSKSILLHRNLFQRTKVWGKCTSGFPELLSSAAFFSEHIHHHNQRISAPTTHFVPVTCNQMIAGLHQHFWFHYFFCKLSFRVEEVKQRTMFFFLFFSDPPIHMIWNKTKQTKINSTQMEIHKEITDKISIQTKTMNRW